MNWRNRTDDKRISARKSEIEDELRRRESQLEDYMGRNASRGRYEYIDFAGIQNEEAARARAAMGEPDPEVSSITVNEEPWRRPAERPYSLFYKETLPARPFSPGYTTGSVATRPGVFGKPLSTGEQIKTGMQGWKSYEDQVMGTHAATNAAGAGLTRQARDRAIAGREERGTDAERFMARLDHEAKIKEMETQGARDVAEITTTGRLAQEAERRDKYQGPVVRGEGGVIGLWDRKERRYKWQLPPSEGAKTEFGPDGYSISPGGRPFNAADLPVYKEEESAPAAPLSYEEIRNRDRAIMSEGYNPRTGKVDVKEGEIAINPATGAKMIYRGGKWI